MAFGDFASPSLRDTWLQLSPTPGWGGPELEVSFSGRVLAALTFLQWVVGEGRGNGCLPPTY